MTDDQQNRFEGTANNVVQAGSLYGDVHFHAAERVKVIPRQLPPRLHELINQHRVLRRLAEPAPLKVLLGMRGIGKSSVALASLHERIDSYPDGQLYANLGGWTAQPRSAGDVLADFLVSLGEDRASLPVDLGARQALYRSLCRDKAIQVFLDDAVTPAQVRALLPGTDSSLVVVTGHGSFGSLVRDGAELIDVAPLEAEMARLLLTGYAGERVAAEPAAAESLLELCGGLPIALSVVGALLAGVPKLRIEELLDELRGDIATVTSDDGESVAAVFDAAYRRLGPAAQSCYRLLGLHPGDGAPSFEVLVAGSGLPQHQVREGLRVLSARRIVEPADPDRYVVHGLVRAHARGVASDSGERARMLRWYLAEAAAADRSVMPNRLWRTRFFPDLVVGTERDDPRGWFEAERANLTAAVLAAYEHGDLETTVRLCVLLWSLHEPGKYFDDLLTTHEAGIPAARALGRSDVESLLLTQRGFAERHRGEFDQAIATLREAAECGARDPELAATALEALGLVLLDLGRRDEAAEALSRNLGLAMEINDPRRIALARLHFAKVVEPALAVELLDLAVREFEKLAEKYNVGKALTWKGKALGDRDILNQALQIMSDLDRPFDGALVLDALGDVAVSQGQTEQARERYTEALALYERLWLRDRAAATRFRLSELD